MPCHLHAHGLSLTPGELHCADVNPGESIPRGGEVLLSSVGRGTQRYPTNSPFIRSLFRMTHL